MSALPQKCPVCGNDDLDREYSVEEKYYRFIIRAMFMCYKCRWWIRLEGMADVEWEVVSKAESEK